MYGHHTTLPSDSRNDIKTLKSLTPYLWDYRSRAGLAILCVILAKVANVGVPLLLKDIIDQLNPTGQSMDEQSMIVLPLGLLLAYGVLRLSTTLFNELRDSIFAKVRYGAMRNVSLKVLRHLHKLSLRFHLERKTGAISRDIERGTRSIGSMLNYMLFSILPTFVEFVLVASILLINYDPWFTVVSFSSVIIYVLFTFKITSWRMQFRTRMNQADSSANTRAIDSLINYETVKYFGNEDYETVRYNEDLREWEDAGIKSQTSLSALNVGQGAIIAIGVTIIMMLASDGVVSGELTIGDLVMVNALLLQLFIPLNFLGIVYSQLKHALTDMERMFDLLEEPPEITEKPGAKPLRVGDGEIEFNNVNFSYNQNRQILFDVSFRLPAGKKVAIAGPSGSGKSTIARLLFRFYDVDSGDICINRQDIRDVTQESLRSAIGIVPQDTVLFNDTIYHNISYARPDATRGEVVRAAQLANIDHFIQSLPEDYDTLVGERGLKLSGGEKQRIAIARAILKDPKILIFDEATSSLDSKAEQSINTALKDVARNHTTLVIAHRLSTIVDADEILVMEKGHIVERGNHESLLRQNGLYAHLWELQKHDSDKDNSQ